MSCGRHTWSQLLTKEASSFAGPKPCDAGGPRLREIIETVNDKLLNTFRLARERPHDESGFAARLAAKVGLHNFCIWLNGQLGRAPLAFADLIDW